MIGPAEIRGIFENPDGVLKVLETATVTEAAQRMARHKVGCAIVVQANKNIVGILSERDVLTKVVARRRSPEATLVRDVMSPKVVFCTRETPIAWAQHIMAKNGIRHLPVIEEGVAIGMVSSRDALSHQLSAVEDLVQTQSGVFDRLGRAFPGVDKLRRDAAGKLVM